MKLAFELVDSAKQFLLPKVSGHFQSFEVLNRTKKAEEGILIQSFWPDCLKEISFPSPPTPLTWLVLRSLYLY